MSDIKPTIINGKAFLEQEYGLKITGLGEEPGVLEVEAPDEQTARQLFGQDASLKTQINANQLLQDMALQQGVTNAQFQLSSPDDPINSNPLGVLDQVDLIRAKSRGLNDVRETLKDKGYTDIRYNKGTGNFVVKHRGEWVNVESGGVASLLEMAPGLAAGIGGFAAGAKLGAIGGAALGPVGAAVGGLVGGAAGAATASTATDLALGKRFPGQGPQPAGLMAASLTDDSKMAAAGVKSEGDLHNLIDEAAGEWVDRFVFDLAAGAVIGGAAKAGKAGAKWVGKRYFQEIADDLPAVMESLGFKKGAVSHVVAKAKQGGNKVQKIKNLRDEYINWSRAKSMGQLTPEQAAVDPLAKRAGRLARIGIDAAEANMKRAYKSVNNVLKASGADNVKIDTNSLADDLFRTFDNFGIQLEAGGRIPKGILGLKDSQVNALNKKLAQMGPKGAGRRASQMNVSDMRDFVRSIDSIISPGDATGLPKAAMALKSSLRSIGDRQITKALTGVKVKVPEKIAAKYNLQSALTEGGYDAGKIRSIMNKQYGDTRGLLEQFGSKAFRVGAGADDVAEVGNKFAREAVMDSSATMQRWIKAVKGAYSNNPAKAQSLIDNLLDVSAASEFTALKNPSGKVTANLFAASTDNPSFMAKLRTSAGNPREALDAVERIATRRQMFGGPGLQRMRPAAQHIGRFFNALNSTSAVTKHGTVSGFNPELMRNLWDSTLMNINDELAVRTQLEQQIQMLQQSRGGR